LQTILFSKGYGNFLGNYLYIYLFIDTINLYGVVMLEMKTHGVVPLAFYYVLHGDHKAQR
jgi:hypothetical protein